MWILIAVALLLVAGAAGGGAWYFLKHKAADHASADADDEEPAHRPAKSGGGAATPHAFVHLDPFTTNLADDGGERVAQITVNVELEDATTQEHLNQVLPIVRNQILYLISSRDSASLLTISGKNDLADEMALRIGMAMGWEPPEPVDAIADIKRSDKSATNGSTTARPEGATAEKTDRSSDPRRRKRSRRTAPNPVAGVHFEQFIVQ